MGRRKSKVNWKSSIRDILDAERENWELLKQRWDREDLTLSTHPIRTFYFFNLATVDYLKGWSLYILRHSTFFSLSVLVLACGAALLVIDGPHEKSHPHQFTIVKARTYYFVGGTQLDEIELLKFYKMATSFYLTKQLVTKVRGYASYRWLLITYGVESSIGLGSGFNMFFRHMGPRIFSHTITVLICNGVGLKVDPTYALMLAPGPVMYCSRFEPPLFTSLLDSLVKIPLSKILPQVQFEAVLWGLGTALVELPPYFISKAASLSGSKIEAMEGSDVSAFKERGSGLSAKLDQAKQWLFLRTQHLNFFTILTLALVPNPLFSLVGIMCGQFGIPFWKFFFATLIGKAIKTHIQTIFIIAVIHNLLGEELEENRLIWVLGHIPGIDYVLPEMRSTLCSEGIFLNSMYSEGKQWKFYLSMAWYTIVWLMLVNCFTKFVTSTAQNYLKKQQELDHNKKKLSSAKHNGISRPMVQPPHNNLGSALRPKNNHGSTQNLRVGL